MPPSLLNFGELFDEDARRASAPGPSPFGGAKRTSWTMNSGMPLSRHGYFGGDTGGVINGGIGGLIGECPLLYHIRE